MMPVSASLYGRRLQAIRIIFKSTTMKSLIIGLTIIAATLAACNNSGNKTAESQSSKSDTLKTNPQSENATATTPAGGDSNAPVSIKEIVTPYLRLKNALTSDNSTDAATAGAALETAFKSFNKAGLNEAQKKTFEEVADDAREHAAHIGKNGGNIKHQREHFDMLSKDMIDLIKAFGTGGQALYKDFCPMYNDNKGAFWISETKEIKNPYLGKAMPACGTMKEEIK